MQILVRFIDKWCDSRFIFYTQVQNVLHWRNSDWEEKKTETKVFFPSYNWFIRVDFHLKMIWFKNWIFYFVIYQCINGNCCCCCRHSRFQFPTNLIISLHSFVCGILPDFVPSSLHNYDVLHIFPSTLMYLLDIFQSVAIIYVQRTSCFSLFQCCFSHWIPHMCRRFASLSLYFSHFLRFVSTCLLFCCVLAVSIA